MAGEKIGALWIKTDRGGRTYFSGEVTLDGKTTHVVVFGNKWDQDKIERKYPHYHIYLSNYKPEQKPVQTPIAMKDEEILF